jgi:hypothetical protein
VNGELYFKIDGMELRKTEGINSNPHGILDCEHAKCTEPSQTLFRVETRDYRHLTLQHKKVKQSITGLDRP